MKIVGISDYSGPKERIKEQLFFREARSPDIRHRVVARLLPKVVVRPLQGGRRATIGNSVIGDLIPSHGATWWISSGVTPGGNLLVFFLLPACEGVGVVGRMYIVAFGDCAGLQSPTQSNC